jgi:predicted SAM-dependent methyltransferase
MKIRKLSDIGKYRKLKSYLIRNKSLFINRKNIDQLTYLNIGCGPKPTDGFINLDYYWRTFVDICWDLEKKNLPLPDNSLNGIFTEHVLEHLDFNLCFEVLKDFKRILKKGGVLRIIVPDAELYFKKYVEKLDNPSITLPFEEEFYSPIIRINGLFRNHGHKVIYDYYTLRKMLLEAGFSEVNKVDYKKGINEELLHDSSERKIESLYMEAIK